MQYNLHNLYGMMMTRTTHTFLNSSHKYENRHKLPFIVSRSTFPGSGRYGAHWSGDIGSTWEDMRQSISSIFNFNIFGMQLSGADICGFSGDASHELCARWF